MELPPRPTSARLCTYGLDTLHFSFISINLDEGNKHLLKELDAI